MGVAGSRSRKRAGMGLAALVAVAVLALAGAGTAANSTSLLPGGTAAADAFSYSTAAHETLHQPLGAGRASTRGGLPAQSPPLLQQTTSTLATSTLFYSTDFESGVSSEWSTLTTSTRTTTSTFLGRFGNQTVSLSLAGMVRHTAIELIFDLLIIDSWDGSGTANGPDYWGFNIPGVGTPAFEHTFSATGSNQSFPGQPDVVGELFGSTGYQDGIYRNVTFSFAHVATATQFSFYGRNLQAISDESWGIDNVRVNLVLPDPVPVTISSPAEVPAGGLFTATIGVDKAGGLQSSTFALLFDPGVLDPVSVTGGLIGTAIASVDQWTVVSPGKVMVSQSLPPGGVTSTIGTLAHLFFNVTTTEGATSTLDFVLGESSLYHAGGETMRAQWNGTAVSVGAAAAGVAQISVNTPAFARVDSTFSATVDVVGVDDLNAASYFVVFDPNALEMTSVTQGTVGGTTVPVDVWTESPAGVVGIVQSLSGLSFATGDGYLARLHFQVIGAEGTASDLGFEYKTEQRVLSNTSAVAIPAQWLGGRVTITIHETADVVVQAPSQAGEGRSFLARISVSPVVNLDAANFEVVFDPNILSLSNVQAGAIGGVTIPVDLWNQVSPGRVSVVQDVPGLTGATGSGYLADLVFDVTGIEGQAGTIALANVVLSDVNAGTIPSSAMAATVDVTPVITGEIRGAKFDDLDGNGMRGPGEPGLAGWTVFLDDNADGLLDPGEASTVTNASGDYAFIELPAGTYAVAEVPQIGWRQTAPEYTAVLSGANEVTPVTTTGSGFAYFVMDEEASVLYFDVTFSNVTSSTSTTTGLHIHRAAPGQNGPVIYNLAIAAGAATTGFASPVTGTLAFSPADLPDLQAGSLYVNLHTDAVPSGEVRGQIVSSTAHHIGLVKKQVVGDRNFGNIRKPTFSVADLTVGEEAGSATVTITLDPPVTSSAVTVDYVALDGTASAPGDYGSVGTTTAVFAAGATSKTLAVIIVEDALDELDETLFVVLSNPSAGVEVSHTAGTSTVALVDNDPPPTVSVQTAASVTEGAFGTAAQVDVVLTLSATSGLPVSLQYVTVDGTATAAGGDYVPVSGGAGTIAAGNATGTVQVTVNGDDTFEANETFTVALSIATTPSTTTPLTITQGTMLVTIVNEDGPVAQDDTYSVFEDTTFTTTLTSGVLLNDSNVAGLARTVALTSDVSSGALTLNSDGSFTYTPDMDFPYTASAGVDSFSYSFTSGGYTSNVAVATITVTNVNDPPVANNDSYPVIPGTDLIVAASAGVLANDTDIESDTLTAVLVAGLPSDGSQGTLTFNVDGSFVYDPGTFVGTAVFTYRAKGPSGVFSNVATVTLSRDATVVPALSLWAVFLLVATFGVLIRRRAKQREAR